MIDSLVNALVLSNNRGRSRVSAPSGPITMALRSKNDYVDRFHQFLLPQWFYDVNWRTNQALHYSPALLANASAQTICYPARGQRARIPRLCQQLWINYRRSCAANDAEGKAVGVIHVNIMERLRTVQQRFPGLSIDLTLLESHGDLQVSKGGFSSLGFLWGDVSTIIRARNCTDDGTNNACETLYIDDYRYETGLLVSDIVQWYRVVAALRIIGQGYFFIRVIGLILSCYYAYSTPKSRPGLSRWSRFRKATSLFMKVPTQCVVYGSPFPVACYVLAHALDAPFTYQILESRFFSAGGIFNFSFREFISYAVVQMRNVWLYTLGWHLVVSVSTSRWIIRNTRQNNGILGVPEFFLSAFSSLTLIAQYRSTSFRSTEILEVMALPDNVSSAWELAKYRYNFGYRGRGNTFLGGVIIDLKFLTCLVLAVATVRVAHLIWVQYWSKTRDKGRHSDIQWYFIAPTPVAYSAGILWPSVSMCVHWTSDFFCIQETQRKLGSSQKLTVAGNLGRNKLQVLPLASAVPVQVPSMQVRNNSVSIVMSVGTFRYIQHQMNCLHGRSDVVEANVAFMNVVLMSDPLVYLRILYGRDHRAELAYYQSTLRPQQILLLPVEVVGNHNKYSLGFKLLRRVNPGDLSWAELVQCG